MMKFNLMARMRHLASLLFWGPRKGTATGDDDADPGKVWEAIGRVLNAKGADFSTLVKLSGLDPTKDFINSDLTGVDLRHVDLSEFNLMRCRISRGALSEEIALAMGVVEVDIPFQDRSKSQPTPT